MSEQTPFGTLLRRYRTATGLTQEALAARAQLSACTIADLERGINRLPHHDTFELLMAALNVTTQQRALFLAMARPEMTAAVAQTSSLLPLPLPPTALIGREQEMARALAFLKSDGVRLLTLTGPAGIGKTRLGLQIARDLEEHFTQGVVFVSLATLRDARLIPNVIAGALGLHESSEEDISEQVTAFLREKHFLLALDNFEQIIHAASFVANLLSTCAHLSILVTSRMSLRLRAEQVLPLAPLPIEDAVTLFQDRATAIQPGRPYASQEVAAICERLDRLPLAIELAAIHVRSLSLPMLYNRLTERLTLLRGGARDLPARQQTMKDAIAWSYELLTPAQQRYFRSLGVFVGGWTAEAAEAVCWTEGEKIPEESIFALAALLDASLIQVDILPEGLARFRMLELIQDYALERLRAEGEEEQCRRRHAAYYANLAEIAEPEGPEPEMREARLIQDIANVRTALQWAEERREVNIGLRLARFSWHGWLSQNQMSEAEGWLARMLTLSWQSKEQGTALAGCRAEALYTFGQILLSRGKMGYAEIVARDALDRTQKAGDHCGICSALAILGQIAQGNGDLNEAEAFFTESDAHARLGEYPDLRGFTLRNLAEIARMQGDLTRAIVFYEEAMAVARTLGMTFGVALITTLLGHLACQQQSYALAKTRYRESLVVFHAFNSSTYIAWCLEGFAAVLNAEKQYAQATRLCAAATTLRAQAQTPLPPAERKAFEEVVAATRAALNEPTFGEEWTIGARTCKEKTT